jgi:hypothetical protein
MSTGRGEEKYLRIVVLEDNETIRNVFLTGILKNNIIKITYLSPV